MDIKYLLEMKSIILFLLTFTLHCSSIAQVDIYVSRFSAQFDSINNYQSIVDFDDGLFIRGGMPDSIIDIFIDFEKSIYYCTMFDRGAIITSSCYFQSLKLHVNENEIQGIMEYLQLVENNSGEIPVSTYGLSRNAILEKEKLGTKYFWDLLFLHYAGLFYLYR